MFSRWRGRLLAVLIISVFADSRSFAQGAAATQTVGVSIALVGDSTVTDDAGWAIGFGKCLSPDVSLKNLSRGGRSSKSFIAEGRWKEALALKPNYILIQFGHNDQPGHGPDRETDPQTTYKQYLMHYVQEARAAGATPVLVTPLARREWTADGKIRSSLAPYAEAVRQIAAEQNVPLVDLQASSIALYERYGKEQIFKISPPKTLTAKDKNGDTATTQNSGKDGTHLNQLGSALVGRIVADQLTKAVPALAGSIHLPPEPVIPQD